MRRAPDVFMGITPKRIVTDDGERLDVPERMTVAQFAAFPWPELQRWELIQGVPVMAASPVGKNQNLLIVLTAFLAARFPDLFV